MNATKQAEIAIAGTNDILDTISENYGGEAANTLSLGCDYSVSTMALLILVAELRNAIATVDDMRPIRSKLVSFSDETMRLVGERMRDTEAHLMRFAYELSGGPDTQASAEAFVAIASKALHRTAGSMLSSAKKGAAK